jgi:hypothetical protein
LLGLDLLTSTNVVLRWSSVTNHTYAIHFSTNLLSGFSCLQSNLIATPVVNVYTDSLSGSMQRFWQITTTP